MHAGRSRRHELRWRPARCLQSLPNAAHEPQTSVSYVCVAPVSLTRPKRKRPTQLLFEPTMPAVLPLAALAPEICGLESCELT